MTMLLAIGRLALGNRLVQWGLAALAALALFAVLQNGAYERGKKDCRSTAQAAVIKTVKVRDEKAADLADKATARAVAAEKRAAARETAADKAIAAARAQPNAKSICLTEETTDAIRAIR